MDTLTTQQKQIIDGIIKDGSIYRALESSMKDRERDGYFAPWHWQTSYRINSKLENEFARDYSLRKTIIEVLKERGEIIFYNRKDVGALIRFNGGNFQSCILTDYLVSTTSTMNLDNAQINELERLLNKANRSLNISLPPVPAPTDQEMEDTLLEMALETIRSKPQHFHQKYLDSLAARGTPVAALNKKDFHIFAEKILAS